MQAERKVVPAVLIYARLTEPSQSDKYLLIHRGGRPGDYHEGRWNGLGGKLEANESPRQAASREFSEEAGLALPEERFSPLGFITFPNFKPRESQDWWVVVFTVDV